MGAQSSHGWSIQPSVRICQAEWAVRVGLEGMPRNKSLNDGPLSALRVGYGEPSGTWVVCGVTWKCSACWCGDGLQAPMICDPVGFIKDRPLVNAASPTMGSTEEECHRSEVWLVLSSRMSAGDMNKTKHWRAIWIQISLGLASSGPRLAHSCASLQRHAPWCPFPRGCALHTVFLVLLSSYLLVKVFLSPSLSSFPASSVSSLPPQGRTCWTSAGGLEEGGFPMTWGCLVLPDYWPLLLRIQTFDVLLYSPLHCGLLQTF